MRWLLLVYTLPAEPTRKRAFVWRLLKKLGAVYLRDGICVLPDRSDTRTNVRAVARKIQEFGGQASLAQDAQLDAGTVEVVRERSREARRAEYAALLDAGNLLVVHLKRERRHRDLSLPELDGLANDLLKLRRWYAQIVGRDYFLAEGRTEAEGVLDDCQAHLARTRAMEPGLLGATR